MPHSEPCLRISGLIKDFGPVSAGDGKRLRVLDGVDLIARPGEVTALLGANGAGKTTTLECAQGLQKPSGGTVSLLGENPYRAGAALRSRVGVMLQDGGLPPAARPLALLGHVAGMYSRPRPVADLTARLGIDAFGRTPVRRLSGGQKQRLALAAALVGDPQVLFLDEPSAGLDPQSRHIVFDLIQELRAEGMAIILTTHLLDDAQRLADCVYIIDGGKTVAHGSVAELTAVDLERHDRILTFETTADLEFPPNLVPHLNLTQAIPGRYALSGNLTSRDLAAVTAWLDAKGILPTSIHMAPRTLEDVFLDISGRDMR